jgi:hypothetical protein
MPVIAKRAETFTCESCLLVQHHSRIAFITGGHMVHYRSTGNERPSRPGNGRTLS